MIIQPRPFNLRKTLTVLAVLGVAFYFYYQRPPPLKFWKISGMHWSAYSVKFLEQGLTLTDIEAIKADIDAVLNEINQQCSTYKPDSVISGFNQREDVELRNVPRRFGAMTRLALELCEQTSGAFNPTLDHLINAWGFGPQGPRRQPTPEEIQEALALADCGSIEVQDDEFIRKKVPGARLNLNAIAEGWAVDEVAGLLMGRGITNYFVEIGGEIRASGHSDKMRRWRAGIDRPTDGAAPGEAYDLIVELDQRALATSGNYRNFTLLPDGQKVAHILDPRTGQPATSPLASVSVIAPTCALADALATALFVMGVEEGLEWVNQYPEVEAVFISHGADGSIDTQLSAGFSQYILKPEN